MDARRHGRPPSVGLVVNPVAGLGGRVGLKGSDGLATVAEALARGARPIAPERAREAIVALLAAWPATLAPPVLRTVAAPMGADALSGVGGVAPDVIVLPLDLHQPTVADDTRAAVAVLAQAGVDLLVFVGGDGTARDVHAALVGLAAPTGPPASSPPVLGVPAGVKLQSGVFGTSPAAAGDLAARWLSSRARRTEEREVLDLDEDAYRAGRVAPRLHGVLVVPSDRTMQGRKSPTPPEERSAVDAIAREVAASMVPGRRYVLGPGTTVAALAARLGVAGTLVGVDVVEVAPAGDPGASPVGCLLAADVGERELLASIADRPSTIIVTPVGGQGFLFGRGNQPISPAVIRTVGREHIMVVASAAKLAALGGRPLLVDTGDPALDRELAGPVRVVTGEREAAVVTIEPA